jgi:hypothetical protein
MSGRALLLSLALALAGFLLMVGAEHAGAGPGEYSSQLQLQFAWNAEQARAVLASWGEAGRARVSNGIYADTLFLIGYAWLLAQLMVALGRHKHLAWVPVFAGALDALENVLLLGLIQGRLDAGISLAIGLVATLKFALIGACLIYLGAAWRSYGPWR